MSDFSNSSKENSDGVNNSEKKSDSKEIFEKKEQPKYDYVDMLLRKRTPKKIEIDTLIKETQKRVWASLKQGAEYNSTLNDSDQFLRKHVFSRIHLIVLYVDLVGSTDITLTLPEEKVAIIISSFAQEMSSIIKQFDGLTLKFVGDAVIGYFVAETTSSLSAINAVNCARSMVTLIEKGINPILNQYDYPELKIKVGMDYGENMIVRYGSDDKLSHVDILGPAMNIAAKIQDMAQPNQILIGEDVFTRLDDDLKKLFEKVVWRNAKWKYQDRETGQLYPVYAFTG